MDTAAEATIQTSQNKAHSMTACVRGLPRCPGAHRPRSHPRRPWQPRRQKLPRQPDPALAKDT